MIVYIYNYIEVNKMKQIILDIAKEMNIENIGFTNVMNYDYLEDFFNERAKNNYNNELEEYDVSKRFYVKELFPNCKSIIAVGLPYAKGYKKINVQDKGLLSVSSFGEDYHIKLKRLLNDFAQKISGKVDLEYMICVDTSPLIDREISKNASIGNYGKNSLLINSEIGSFMYLGYILTNLEIQSSNEKFENTDICKDCNICVESCPNNAILKNGVVNTKKCVSYLTQTKSYIPFQDRKKMSNQIYGCDICQIVCPKNNKVLSMKSNNNYQELIVNLDEVLDLTNLEFKKKYGNIAGSWRGKNIWKRNAIISIANLDIKSMYDKVSNELNNPSHMIKIYSAWSMMILNKQKTQDILHINLKYENDMITDEYKKLLEEEL
jgi:epoxyqueuosine reductase